MPNKSPKRTRVQGRRSDPEYAQVGAYVPRKLHTQVKIQLLNQKKDFSELIEELLEDWIQPLLNKKNGLPEGKP
ncbi:hypothetical protein PseudUWO311_09845 [Pseudanabaena sp. UWO311]|uniref:hypothetical protein n=1 Tax=Pseudanabaena sp. UWO311 TaxID=2487337 RepID=UPI00115B72F9|nr:hypothetical protein [Pseudanabaena sp. UWO311]TYQ26979.1 hypothetical protein PseudUWO311_09845 [Pseudanabaena sp. UWO311]